MEINKEKSIKIIKANGVKDQLKKFAEENYELIEAIYEHDLTFDSQHIAEEIADNILLLHQFMLYFKIKPEDVEQIIAYKQDRTLYRLGK